MLGTPRHRLPEFPSREQLKDSGDDQHQELEPTLPQGHFQLDGAASNDGHRLSLQSRRYIQ